MGVREQDARTTNLHATGCTLAILIGGLHLLFFQNFGVVPRIHANIMVCGKRSLLILEDFVNADRTSLIYSLLGNPKKVTLDADIPRS